jgi:hypothetical protein
VFELLNILPGPGLARLLLEILEIGLLELFLKLLFELLLNKLF